MYFSKTNVFFLVEVMRALAETTGELSEISRRTLPMRVFAGGMRAVVERRLQRLPAPARALLKLAAVAGRRLDLTLLRAAAPAEAERWLMPCAEAAVLEVVEQRWQFAHDKIRERLLEEVDPAELRALHARVARAIEAAYTDLDQFAAALAHHYREAAEPVPAARYDLRAGELALRDGALQTAVTHLQAALRHYEAQGGDQRVRVRLRRRLSEVSFALGQVEACIDHFRAGRALLERPFPDLAPRRTLQTLAEAGRQVAHVFAPRLAQRSQLGRQQLQELIALNRAAQEAFLWHGQDGDAILCGMAALNAAEDTGDVNEDLVSGYAFVAYLMCLLGQERAARFYLARAEQRLTACPDPLARFQLLRAAAPIKIMWRDWDAALADCSAAVQIARSLGDVGRELFCTLHEASANFYSGRHQEASGFAEELRVLAQLAGNTQYVGWACCLAGDLILRCGDVSEARAPLQRAHAIATEAHDTLGELYATGLRAAAALHTPDRAEARHWAEQTLRCAARTPLPGHGLLEGYAAPVEVFLTLAADTTSGRERAELLPLGRRALDVLKSYASRIPMGRARALLWEGQWARLHGQHERALSLWEQGRKEAHASGMRYDAALSSARLGTALPHGSAARIAHLARARRELVDLGVSDVALRRVLPPR